MTPQEKANELIEKFLPTVRGADRYNYNLESMNVFIAKQCALICVGEVIEIVSSDLNKYAFWLNVSNEISLSKKHDNL